MKAIQMTAIGKFELREVNEPVLEPGHVIVSTEAAGVCGTDLHVLNDGVYVTPETDLPVTMGHESVGIVTAVAPDVSELKPGDRVVIEPVLHCGVCVRCQDGRVNICSGWVHLGFTVDGVWAERFAVPVNRTTKIAFSVPSEIATLAEPLACSLHFLTVGKLRAGQTILIIGGGPSGQLAAVAAQAMGASLVVLSDPNEHRRALAHQLGVHATIDALGEDVGSRAAALTQGEGFDVVLEIAGSASSIASAFLLAKPGGMVVLAGVCGQEELMVNTQFMVRNEVTIQGAFATRNQMPNAVALLERDDLDFSPLIGLRLHWHDAGRGLNDLTERRDICKIVLMFNPTEAGECLATLRGK